MSNGLDDLNQRRASRKRRTPPPPAHPRSTHPTDSGPSEQPHPESDRARRRSDARRGGRTPSVEVYLDAELREWLDEVEDAGFARRERAVISPVVRLALRELAARMTPADAVIAAVDHSRNR